MGYVKIKVLEKGSAEDLQRWKDHMMEEPKCWNKGDYVLYYRRTGQNYQGVERSKY